jgi:ABC-type antimicrobial peptide transport system permease subunit
MKQALKMVWNQRRSYYGIFTEQVLVAVILMLSVVSVSEAIKKYKTPGMLNVENTYMIGYMFGAGVQPDVMKNTGQSMNVIIENLRKLPYVTAITKGYNLTPYMKNDEYYYYVSDSISIDDKRFRCVIKVSDEFAASILNPDMEEGVWIENHALPDGSIPAVITRQFADKAGWSSSIGKKINSRSSTTYTVVGVVSGLKQEPFMPSPVAIVTPYYLLEKNSNAFLSENMAKIKAGMEKEFIATFNNEFKRLISDKNVEPLINDMQSLKSIWMSSSILPVALQGIPTLFLFIFAFIGTFGLYWMSAQKRLKEFALRIALGSTKSRLIRVVTSESLLITCLAVLPALLLSFFIYEYTAVHVVAIGATIGVMLLFSAISAWYPAWKVSRVNPAEALQYE